MIIIGKSGADEGYWAETSAIYINHQHLCEFYTKENYRGNAHLDHTNSYKLYSPQVLSKRVEPDKWMLQGLHTKKLPLNALLTKDPTADILIAFGTGKNFTYIHINAICNALEKCKSMSLPIFHGFIGCYTTSAFLGKGKKSAWEAWNSYPEVTQAFVHMSTHPHTSMSVESWIFQSLQHYTVVFLCQNKQFEVL